MKPIAIFRHSANEGPGSFTAWLQERGVPGQLIRIDAGDTVPVRPQSYAGLVFMGGPMSVNDDLPWVARELELIRAAVVAGIPVLGHCLGGQLMSKALGGTVGRNPVKEIGWGRVQVEPTPVAADWFGELREFLSFHWHGETFTIPSGAEHVARSDFCANQGFVIGPHLGMQFHVEMVPEVIRTWYTVGADEMAASPGPAVQTARAMEVDIDARTADLRRVAWRLYDRWARNLAR